MAQNAGTTAIASDDDRPIAARVREYDWDAAITAGAGDVDALLSDTDCEAIAAAFWEHYLSLPATRHLVPLIDATLQMRQLQRSARYMRLKYAAPFDEAWRLAASRHADISHDAGVPLAALLAALAFAHSRTLEMIETRLGGDVARMRRLGDVVQRLALIEADVMAAHLAGAEARRVADERAGRAQAFRDQIAGAIGGAAALGEQVRAQAAGVLGTSSAMAARSAEVAAAAEQSAAAMRDAASTAAGRSARSRMRAPRWRRRPGSRRGRRGRPTRRWGSARCCRTMPSRSSRSWA